MANITQLWNPRGNNRLRRYWIRSNDRIVIGGDTPEQSGVLMLLPPRSDGLCARLQVMGTQFEETVAPGNDIAVWINGLELFVGVKAVEDERLLVAFGIPHGSKVNVTLEAGARPGTQAMAITGDVAGERRQTHGRSSGLCQTLN